MDQGYNNITRKMCTTNLTFPPPPTPHTWTTTLPSSCKGLKNIYFHRSTSLIAIHVKIISTVIHFHRNLAAKHLEDP